MTSLKEEAMRRIDNLPEDKIEYVIQYIRDMTYRENVLKKRKNRSLRQIGENQIAPSQRF